MRVPRFLLATPLALILAATAAAPAAATYPGRVGRLAFGVDVGGNVDIYSVRADGTDPRRLTDDPGFDACAAYNATGTRIAFCRQRAGDPNVEIWTMAADGSDQRQLTSLGSRATFPEFSPDGRRVAFGFRPDASATGQWDIWTIRTDGTRPRQLTDTADQVEVLPAYSPNGHKIVFIRQNLQRTESQVWVMNRNGRHQRQLTFDATFKDQLPDWRPDGTKIAYESGRDIWVMNADGTGQVNVTNTPTVQEYGTAWSPDGKRIAYLNLGDRQVYTMKADGTDVQRVGIGLGPEFVPAWGPKAHRR